MLIRNLSVVVTLAAVLAVLSAPVHAQMSRKSINRMSAKLAPCLSADIRLDEVAEYRRPKRFTVADKLNGLNARCRRDRLVGKHNQEIKFFRLQCFGVPPPNYDELQAEQRRMLSDLRSKYIVIVIACDPRLP